MKRNTITAIELVIVLCVIVVAVRVWTSKNPEVKTLSPTPTYNLSSRYKCPQCGSSYIQHLGIIGDGTSRSGGEICNECGFHWGETVEKCPKCGSSDVEVISPLDEEARINAGKNKTCRKCGLKYE